MKKKSVTMSDIAKTMDISTVTVSKALGDKEGVSDELREKIKQRANEMGYRFNYASKAAREGLTFNISIVVAKHFIQDASAFYWVVYRHIVELLQKQNYYGILDVVGDSDNSQNIMPNSVSEKKVDGVIVLGQFSAEYVKNLLSCDIPVVFLDFYSGDSNADTILADNFFGSYMLTSHLINNGHRNIGFIGTVNSTSSIQDRYLGYYKAMLEKDIAVRDEWVIADRGNDGSIYSHFDLPVQKPTAFVCNCDEAAYTLVNQLRSEGYIVPDDISVVGYDNHIYSTISNPRITTVDVDSKRMSHEAVETIIKKIRDKNFTRGRMLVTGKLVLRESVRNLNK